MATKNQYAENSKKKSILQNLTSGNVKLKAKDAAVNTLQDLVLGMVVGGAVGSAIGRPSLLTGILVTGIGHYAQSRVISSIGFGIMASGFQKKSDLSGLDGVKERLNSFKDDLKHRLYLDKLLKGKKKGEATSGVGDVQYFLYPDNQTTGTGELDMSALDRIERQINQSGEGYAQVQGILPADSYMGELDPMARNY